MTLNIKGITTFFSKGDVYAYDATDEDSEEVAKYPIWLQRLIVNFIPNSHFYINQQKFNYNNYD